MSKTFMTSMNNVGFGKNNSTKRSQSQSGSKFDE